MSITEMTLLIIFAIFSLIMASFAARRPKTVVAGVVVGTLTGLLLLLATSAFVGFLGNVLPFGQIDFWLASIF